MSYQVLSQRERTAHNQYDCIWCTEKILVGERYVSMATSDGSEFQFTRWHPECAKASADDFRVNREDEFPPHEFKRGSTEAYTRP